MTSKRRLTPKWLTARRRRRLYQIAAAGGYAVSAAGAIAEDLWTAVLGFFAAVFPTLAQDNTDPEETP